MSLFSLKVILSYLITLSTHFLAFTFLHLFGCHAPHFKTAFMSLALMTPLVPGFATELLIKVCGVLEYLFDRMAM